MEANTWAYRAVSHACSEPVNGHYYWCDHPGKCAVDVITDHPANDIPYGPGANFDINTLQEFHIRVDFEEDDNGQFTRYYITLTQGDKTVRSQPEATHLHAETTRFILNFAATRASSSQTGI